MKRLAYFLAAIAAAVLIESCTDAQALTVEAARVTLAADSIHVRVPIAVPAGADSARITLTLTPGGARTLTASPLATALTFAFAAPAEGASIALQACGTAYRMGTAGPQSCNTVQHWTRPVAAPGPVTWPDTMQISAMQFPDSASLALIGEAETDALLLPTGDTLASVRWLRWGTAFWPRGVRDTNTWREVSWQAMAFARSAPHRDWWQQVKSCGGCTVYLPFDGSLPGAKS